MTKQTRVSKTRVSLSSSSATSRIALGLLAGPAHGPGDPASGEDLSGHSVLLNTVLAAIRARALRRDHVPSELLLDPAWDMLLELFRAEVSGRQLTASTLAKAAGVTTGSGLRWIDALVAKGLCVRGDRVDDGRMEVSLSPRGSSELHAYFAKVMQP